MESSQPNACARQPQAVFLGEVWFNLVHNDGVRVPEASQSDMRLFVVVFEQCGSFSEANLHLFLFLSTFKLVVTACVRKRW